MPAPTRRYAVFLSYRHADNRDPGRQWATWLHQILESYEVPPDLVGTPNGRGEPIPASLYPVFRDEEELPADADLTHNIRQALENSGLLVVLCSPGAVASRFVAEEIRCFKELGKADRILAFIVDGNPNDSDDPAGRQGTEECFPEPLRFGVARDDGTIDWVARAEPIAADARPGGQSGQGWTSSAPYREQLEHDGQIGGAEIEREVREYERRLDLAKLKIVAGALAVPLGTLTQRDKVAQLARARKSARTLRRWLAAVAVLAIAAVVGGVMTYQQSDRRRILLEEAARSDRLVADTNLQQGDSRTALAHLSRAIGYDPASPLAAEKAVIALNAWDFPPPIVICQGHDKNVTRAQFSRDGERILTTSLDGTARVWGARSGNLMATLKGHDYPVAGAQFSPDGQRIVTVSLYAARVFEAQSGKLLLTLQASGVESAQFSPGGQYILTVSDAQIVQVWDAQSGEQRLATLRGQEAAVYRAQFSPDGHRIVTASKNTARVWDVRSDQLLVTLEGHESFVWKAQFSPDGQRIVTASADKTARVWDAQSGRTIAILQGHDKDVRSAEFSPDGKRIITVSDDHTARLWEAQSGELVNTMEGHDTPGSGIVAFVASAQFSPDGQRILIVSGDKTAQVWEASKYPPLPVALDTDKTDELIARFSPDGRSVVTFTGSETASLWDPLSGSLLATLQGHTGMVTGAEFSPDGRYLVTAGDGTARVWETRRVGLLVTFEDPESNTDGAEFSPDGSRIVTTNGWAAQVWDTKSGAQLAKLEGHDSSVNSAQFSPDGRRLVTASADKTARVWDAQSGQTQAILRGHQDDVRVAQFGADGQLIVSASSDKTARVWNAQRGEMLHLLAGHEGVVADAQFSADGQWIVTASFDKTARVWEAQTGRLAATLTGHQAGLSSAQFSSDGQRIVTSSGDRTARVWDTRSGKSLVVLNGHNRELRSAQFSPDGQRIVTASEDRTARIWDSKSGEMLATLDGHEREVTSAEFSPAGQLIVTRSETARLWEAQGGSLMAVLPDGNRAAQISRDGQHLVTSDTEPSHVWTLLPPSAGAPPEWFRDFLHFMAQRRLNSSGAIEAVPLADWLAMRERLRVAARATNETPFLRPLRQFLRD